MIQVKCTEKFKDRHGVIYGYTLEDIYGNTKDVTPDDLKNAILNKQIDVVNLTLTSDNRLVDKNPNKSLNNIKTNKVKKRESLEEYLTRRADDIMDLINKSIETELYFFCAHDTYVLCCGTYYTTLSPYFKDGRSKHDYHEMCLQVAENQLSSYVYSSKREIEYNHITVKELTSGNIELFIDTLKKLLNKEFLGDGGEIVISNNTIIKNTLYEIVARQDRDVDEHRLKECMSGLSSLDIFNKEMERTKQAGLEKPRIVTLWTPDMNVEILILTLTPILVEYDTWSKKYKVKLVDESIEHMYVKRASNILKSSV